MTDDELPGLIAKIAAALAKKPEHFVTHPVEVEMLNRLTDARLTEIAHEHGWRVVRRVGGHQIQFYNDTTIRAPDASH